MPEPFFFFFLPIIIGLWASVIGMIIVIGKMVWDVINE
jgi:hypothetical protein